MEYVSQCPAAGGGGGSGVCKPAYGGGGGGGGGGGRGILSPLRRLRPMRYIALRVRMTDCFVEMFMASVP